MLALITLLYFPLNLFLPHFIQVIVALDALVLLHWVTSKIQLPITVLSQIVVLYHLYLLLVDGYPENVIVTIFVTVIQTIISVTFLFYRIEELVYFQLIVTSVSLFKTEFNEVRVPMCMAVWFFESHFSKETDTKYLAMLVFPMLRLDLNAARVYMAIFIAATSFVLYNKAAPPPLTVQVDVESPEESSVKEEENEPVEERLSPDLTPPPSPVPEIEEKSPEPIPVKKKKKKVKVIEEPPPVVEGRRKINFNILHNDLS